MKIYKKENKIIVEIDLWQKSYDALDNYTGDVSNVVGVIVKSQNDDSGMFEQGIYQLNDLGYKGDIQLGGPLIFTCMEDDEFRKLCKELGIDIWEYNKCVECNEVLWGTHTMNDKGPICMSCDKN